MHGQTFPQSPLKRGKSSHHHHACLVLFGILLLLRLLDRDFDLDRDFAVVAVVLASCLTNSISAFGYHH